MKIRAQFICLYLGQWRPPLPPSWLHAWQRMGLDILEVKPKREIYGKKKGSSAGNGLTDFKQVCVMKVVKNFLPPVGEGEDEETIAPHE